jgi:hypothetical protein
MDGMKTNTMNLLRLVLGSALGLTLMAGVVNAQPATASAKTPEASKDSKKPDATKSTDAKKPAKKTEAPTTSATVGEDAGNFTVTSTIEFGYRGQRVDGDVNKFKSDLNYKAGPRLFDTTFLMKSKNGGKGDLFDTLLVTSTGWGADPSGNMRISVEKPEWYRFEGTYRRFKYYRFLNNIANPTYLFSPNPTVANPVTGLHGFNTKTEMGDFDLTILPKNEKIRFNIGYSPERYSGPAYTTYHNGGNEFWLLSNLKSRANDFRFGADGKAGPIDWTFVQGFRRFRDDSTINGAFGLNRNVASSVSQLTSFLRQEPTRGSVNFTRASIHTLIAKKLDITGRIVYSRATSNSLYVENFSGINFNARITGFPPTVTGASATNTTNPSFYNIAGNVKRPNTVGDIGITFLATDKFRLSNTFRVEDFTIDGIATFSDFFSITRTLTAGGTRTDTFSASNLSAFKTTKYRKYTETFEGDYQFNPRYSVHFGYRYGKRHEEQTVTGYAINSNSPTLLTALAACTSPIGAGCEEFEVENNHTNAFFGGFKARPVKNWTIYFDAEHGTADNVFTRIGNYDYTNIRAKSRFAPNRKVSFSFAVITKDDSNPSEIAGESIRDFGASIKSRLFTSSIDWMPTSRLTINTGYSYTWVNTDSTIDYYYQVPPAAAVFHHFGHALYYQRNNYFFFDLTARINRRMTLYSSYRLNQDNGQGNRLSAPTDGSAIAGGVVVPGVLNPITNAVLGGTLITSYPMNFTSPEARLAIRLNRHVDWNLGYQYYAYNENGFLRTFPGSPRAQNYHAHLPYMSLRLYIGRKE